MHWQPSDTYVAACLRPFSTYAEGREHERYCEHCQRIIHGEPESEEMTTMPKTTDDLLAKLVSDFLKKYVPLPHMLEATVELGNICGEAMREGVRMNALAELQADIESSHE